MGVVTEDNVDKNRWLRYARNETPGIMGMFRDVERVSNDSKWLYSKKGEHSIMPESRGFTTAKGTKQKAIRRCFRSI
jgi:hypothetical protein